MVYTASAASVTKQNFLLNSAFKVKDKVLRDDDERVADEREGWGGLDLLGGVGTAQGTPAVRRLPSVRGETLHLSLQMYRVTILGGNNLPFT